AGPDSTWINFLVPAIIAGAGMGMTFAPMTTIAMRNIQPRMAGAASGVLNTTRQLGAAIGSATVGALLQNQLATALPNEALALTALTTLLIKRRKRPAAQAVEAPEEEFQQAAAG